MTGAIDDRTALCELKARYCRLLDTKAWDDFAALFTDDVVIDTTGSGGPLMQGRDMALGSIRRSLAEAVTVHHVHSPEIVVTGATATGIWAMQDRLVWPNGRRLDGAGHYHEEYVRGADGWQIARSRLTRLFVDLHDG